MTIVFSRHADQRLCERTRLEIDGARDEIEQAVASGRLEHRARNIYALRSQDGERTYIVAVRGHVLVVITVQALAHSFPAAA